MADMTKAWYTPREVARYWCISLTTVRKFMQAGILKVRKGPTGQYKIAHADVEKLYR